MNKPAKPVPYTVTLKKLGTDRYSYVVTKPKLKATGKIYFYDNKEKYPEELQWFFMAEKRRDMDELDELLARTIRELRRDPDWGTKDTFVYDCVQSHIHDLDSIPF